MHNQIFDSSRSKAVFPFVPKIELKKILFVTVVIFPLFLTGFFAYQNFQLRNKLLLGTVDTHINPLESNKVQQKTDTNMYPATKDGFSKYYIWLPTLTDERNNKIEIIVGKNSMVDCNSTSFGADLEKKTVDGWGYSYYEVNKIVGPISTRMGCGDSTKKEAFVRVLGNNYLLDYNSKLPIVVYVPKDFEVQYKIWNTNSTLLKAEKN